jgi:uncharacterized protein YecT (DUF1311 family)
MARVINACRVVLALGLISSMTVRAQDTLGSDDLLPPKSYHFDLVNRDFNPEDPNAHVRPSLGHCLENSGAVDPVVYQCFGEEIAYQDKRLNTAYKALMAVLGENDKQALRTEERKWLKEFNVLCDWGLNDGSRGRMASDQCDVINRGLRATELESRLTRARSLDAAAKP